VTEKRTSVPDVSGKFRGAGPGVFSAYRFVQCGHTYSRGKFKHGMPWPCARCVEAKGGK
jgi:hypothetical protein